MRCGICGTEMTDEINCGGDCVWCMADALDPDAEEYVRTHPRPEGDPILYFAYGMNLDPSAMTFTGAREVGPATLEGWKLEMRVYADVVPCEGERVYGGLWALPENAQRAMDGREGYPGFYDKRTVTVREPDGTEREALVYFMTPHQARGFGMRDATPSGGYLETVHRGLEHFGWDAEVVLEEHLARYEARQAALEAEWARQDAEFKARGV